MIVTLGLEKCTETLGQVRSTSRGKHRKLCPEIAESPEIRELKLNDVSA
jgi:hypothetical protein